MAKIAEKSKSLIPPEDTMWQRYSSHFELPLAGATSLFLHGLVIGVLAIGGLAFFLSVDLESFKPVKMDVVTLEGDGSGFEGEGGEAGLPGSPDAGGGKTEQVTPLGEPKSELDLPMPTASAFKDPAMQIDVPPMLDDGLPPVDGELAIQIAKVTKEAEERVKREMKIVTPPTPKTGGSKDKKPGPAGTGNPKGTGGLGSKGTGLGKGTGKGPGTGAGGGLLGRKGTQQEVYAIRWRFDLSGDAKEHARKLAAMGVTVAIPAQNPNAGFFIITDLNRRPADMKKDNLAEYKDAVKWFNTRPESVQSLARELQLPYVPQFVVLLLPKDREQDMAQKEAQFARNQGRDVSRIQETWFDFRMQNGAYDPTVIRQK